MKLEAEFLAKEWNPDETGTLSRLVNKEKLR